MLKTRIRIKNINYKNFIQSGLTIIIKDINYEDFIQPNTNTMKKQISSKGFATFKINPDTSYKI